MVDKTGFEMYHFDISLYISSIHSEGGLMRKLFTVVILIFLQVMLFAEGAMESKGVDYSSINLSEQPVLYVVGYAHLDTQWRWDYEKSIDDYLKETLDWNFDRFEKYADYTFNFTGSYRYQLMKEYYPERYKRMKEYVDEGRWKVSGSSVDEGDVNVPSAESIVRQVLYGNLYFKEEFDKVSEDFMLPDCFGFPASMPSIWAHCGLTGFSTQKLTWGSAVGIPFNIGIWEGPDGRSIIAALNPGSYTGHVTGRLDNNGKWVDRVLENGERYGVYADYHYYGVGDRGGAPRDKDVRNVMRSIDNPDSKILVYPAASDQMYKDLTSEEKSRLPRYKGDMLLTEHSAGTLTSQCYMKRWNRKNEILADAAERSASAAQWVGGSNYPTARLRKGWEKVLAAQMHDILPGTSVPVAYDYSWNDEVIAMNQFASVLTDGVKTISSALDTTGKGTPLVVYNPLSISRTDLVQADLNLGDSFLLSKNEVAVISPEGKVLPVQVIASVDGKTTILFSATLKPNSYAVYHALAIAKNNSNEKVELRVNKTDNDWVLENEFYRVTVNNAGDPSSIFDKKNNREMLSRPVKYHFLDESPLLYPAWNMDWADRKNPPAGFVDGKAQIKIIENGPVRVALEITRSSRNSVFKDVIRLAAGDAGNIVEFSDQIDWQSKGVSLKRCFPLSVSNPKAVYNWGMGTIERGNNEPKKYEVPSHEWFDLTEEDGSYGVTIVEDCKFGSDKPDDNTLRLTLLYTPQVAAWPFEQATQDWGIHDMVYGLAAHQGDHREAGSEWYGRRLNQPLLVFETKSHPGRLGKNWSFASLSSNQVAIRAIKKAEESELIIVRVQELKGESANKVELSFAAPIEEVWECDGQERALASSRANEQLQKGNLIFTLSPFSPATFAIRLKKELKEKGPSSLPVNLDYNLDVISPDLLKSDGAMELGASYPAEPFPQSLTCEGVLFEMGPVDNRMKNAVACEGQSIQLPVGKYNRVMLLLASSSDAKTVEFAVGRKNAQLEVGSWRGFIGQADNRVWKKSFTRDFAPGTNPLKGLAKGYTTKEPVAWYATHYHGAGLNKAYQHSYIYMNEIEYDSANPVLSLPDDLDVKILAVTVVDDPRATLSSACELFDNFEQRPDPQLR